MTGKRYRVLKVVGAVWFAIFATLSVVAATPFLVPGPGLRHLLADGMVVGAVMFAYADLRGKGRSIEEAYRLGHDVGYDQGVRAGRAYQRPKISVLPDRQEENRKAGNGD